MKSDESKALDVIIEKIDAIARFERERGFLSRLDMMFSVLVSITFFAVGLIINSVRPVDFSTKLLFSLSVTALLLLVYTLVGEFLAILSDDAIMRFGYWVVLVWGIFLLLLWGFVGSLAVVLVTAPKIVVAITIYLFGLIGLPIIVIMLLVFSLVDRLYQKYIRKLCFRGTPTSDGKYLKPTVRGIALIGIFFPILFILVQLALP